MQEFEMSARIAYALTWFWEVRGYLREGRKWLESGIAQREFLSKTVLAKTLYIARRFAFNLGDALAAEAYAKESVALFRELGDQRSLAWALRGLGEIYVTINERERGELFLAEAMTLFQEVGDQVGILFLRLDLAFDAIMNDQYNYGMALIHDHQALAHELDDVERIGMGLLALGIAELFQGNLDESEKFIREGLALIRPFGDKAAFTFILDALAAVADRRHQPIRSARLWGAARHLGEITGDVPAGRWIQRIQDPTIASVRAQLDEASFEAAYAEGYALTIDEAIDYALEATDE
jgi:non-specific serine/threonine protein kinase